MHYARDICVCECCAVCALRCVQSLHQNNSVRVCEATSMYRQWGSQSGRHTIWGSELTSVFRAAATIHTAIRTTVARVHSIHTHRTSDNNLLLYVDFMRTATISTYKCEWFEHDKKRRGKKKRRKTNLVFFLFCSLVVGVFRYWYVCSRFSCMYAFVYSSEAPLRQWNKHWIESLPLEKISFYFSGSRLHSICTHNRSCAPS